ncbi:anhydro-N-acetylmuramic acid kinase [Flexivirga endophytica]|uniref:Anhydro-N-acetylmuramic acid kinase n=1 Tax=Flexivirga endophytica TaxID=1849103 RepID=A0A916WUX0_9MICO|nr:anhydro-N-acetylmuramic acid kinase [Flexivirga endophytica]GGB32007.1 anhydro-N-acetylmuramic acid kinase [Flexivirga endophytica]GHB52978.1 anhydro-N-acetylmuramic acid kinase [Flexivirga endophytica]
MIVVGCISGTSVDGIDVAVADLHGADRGELTLRPLGARTHPWSLSTQAGLLALLPPATTTTEDVCRLDIVAGREIAAAVQSAIDEFAGGTADLVVSHGQTVFHWVEGGTAHGGLQLGQPAAIVERTGLPVVSDVRSRDIAAGGQGAPLAGTMDLLLLSAGRVGRGTSPYRDQRSAALLNLGGIANVTVASAHGSAAFDTGPANCLIDAAVSAATSGTRLYDADGRLAAAGRIDQALLERLLAEPYFALPAPKSTGRELFRADYLDALDLDARGLDTPPPLRSPRYSISESVADLVATLTELTAVTVADALRPYDVTEVYASGGGVRNPVLMDRLAAHLAPARLATSDELGLPVDDKEGYLMALIGYLTWHGIPGVLPGPDGRALTGAGTPRVLGRISPGDKPLRMPEPGVAPRSLRVVD